MRRLVVTALGLLVTLAMVTGAAGATGTTGPFDAVDAAMRARVRDDQLRGGVLLAAHGDTVVHRLALGRMSARTVIPIASASKWLTAATLMTFVDDGRLALDDPVSRYLPAFTGAKAGITVRELLSHRSGLPSALCEGDPGTTLRQCANDIADGDDPTSAPGTEFRYTGVGFVIAGRIIERLNHSSFEEAFSSRVAQPLHMGTKTHLAHLLHWHNRE